MKRLVESMDHILYNHVILAIWLLALHAGQKNLHHVQTHSIICLVQSAMMRGNICDHDIGRSRFRLMLRYIKFTHGYAQLDVYVLV